jgi:hypothetical protein
MNSLKRSRLTSIVAGVALLAVLGAAVVGAATSADQGVNLGGVRAATDAFHNLDIAMAAGYEKFYICTDREGTGGMGQHYVKGDLVADPVLDILRPEVLVYELRAGGGLRLAAVEYVVLKDDWHKTHAAPPRLFGRALTLVPAGNRYGLPDFYEIHVWLWNPNPRGLFNDWNPRVSCRGHGDPAI